MIEGIGILGLGLWDGPRTGNEFFGADYAERTQVKDPYKGRRAEDGSVHIAGMEFTPTRYARTLAAIERSFTDPFRGTRRRCYFPPDLAVSDAEVVAARQALAAAGLETGDVDAVLVQSFLPDQLQPKNDALVAHKLGIRHAPAWCVDSICNSPITQTNVAAALIHMGQARHVLCVQSAVYSRLTDPGTSSSVQEGDMASAFVVGRRPGAQMAFSWRTDGRLHGAIRLQWDDPTGAGPRRYWERSAERLLIRFNEQLQAQVMGEIERNAQIVCHEALEKAGLTIDEIDCFISHQPMSWYDAFITDALGLRDGVSFSTFEEYANVNSASITASLHDAVRAGRITPGARVLVFGPAAGYVFGAMAVRW
jgi:3-oxoacyl-[acyl-carrier-protein] synthase III